MGAYRRPTTLPEAVGMLGSAPHVVLSGGTDFYPVRVGRAIDEDVLDISAITDLKGVEQRDDHWRIGATTTWTELLESELPPLFDGLKLAAREIGGVQIQNAGTIAGNLCNASPAADGVPPLLALDATVELVGRETRLLPLDRFILGPRRVDRRPDELLTAIRVPRSGHDGRSTFIKLGARRYLVISIVMVAVTIELVKERIAAARIAIGACSPVARRLPALEAKLIGRPTAGLGTLVAADDLIPLAPIDDIRGSAGYRRDAALTLLRRALDGLA